MKKIVFGIAFAASALVFTACGGGGGMSAKMPVEEAETLHTSFKADYETVKMNWESAQENAGGVGKVSGVDVAALTNVDQFREALVECYNTPVTEMKSAAKTETKDGASADDAATTAMVGYDSLEGCSTDKVDAMASTGDASVDGFYKSKLDEVDRMRMDLLYLVPNNAQALLEQSPTIIQEVATIRGKAEAALAAAENNPLASDADKAKAKTEYESVITDLDAVETLAKQLMDDFKSVPADAASLGTTVGNDLANFPVQGDAGAAEGEGAAEGDGES